MGISIFKIFNIFGRVSSWADMALEDGKITITEVMNLAEELAVILGVPLEIDVIPDKTRKGYPDMKRSAIILDDNQVNPERYSHLEEEEAEKTSSEESDRKEDEGGP